MRSVLSLALVFGLVGCSNGLGNGLQVKGKVGEMFGQIAAARSADSGTVDTLVAVPHIAGVPYLQGTLTAEADAGSPFELTVEESYDYLLMLVDTQAAEDPTVLGILAMPAGEDTVVNVTTSDATQDVDMGEVTGESGEAVSEEDLAGVFELTDSAFAQLGAGDDGFKNISNAWLNYDPDTGVETDTDLNFWFAGTFADTGTPGSAAFQGANIVVNSNADAMVGSLDDICTGAVRVELVPPGDVVIGGRSYGPSNPISNATMGSDCAGDVSFDNFGTTVSMVVQGNATDELPAGWWLFNVDGVETGFFQLDLTQPVDSAGNPRVPVPSVELTERDGGVDVAITWWVWDGSAFAELEDTSMLHTLFAQAGVQLQEFHGNGEFESDWDIEQVIEGAFFEGWTVEGGLARTAADVSVAYNMAGTQYSFSWRGNAICGNDHIEGDEECDGLAVATSCEQEGLYEPGAVTCTDQCTIDTSGCSVGAVADWVTGAEVPDQGDGAGRGHPIDDSAPGNGTMVGVRVALDANALQGSLYARLELSSMPAAPLGYVALGGGEDGVASLGTLSAGDESTAWFWVEYCPGGSCTAGVDNNERQLAEIVLLDAPDGTELVRLPMAPLEWNGSIPLNAGTPTVVDAPTSTVLGAETSVSVLVEALTGNAGVVGVPWMSSPQSAASHDPAALELLGTQVELVVPQTTTTLSLFEDDGLSIVTTNPSPLATVYSSSTEDRADVTVTAVVRPVRAGVSMDVRPSLTVISGQQLKTADNVPTTTLPAAVNAITIGQVYNSEPSGVFTSSVPVQVGFDTTITNSSGVDVVLDALEVVVPADVTYVRNGGASYQPSDVQSNIWLNPPVVVGDVWTFPGRWRVPANGSAFFAVGTSIGSYGSHTVELSARIGDTVLDTTVDVTDVAPAASTVTVSP